MQAHRVNGRKVWREVKDEEEWWGELKEETLGVVRRMFSTIPSGEIPASNSIRCSRPLLRTDTRAEKPCSASNASLT